MKSLASAATKSVPVLPLRPATPAPFAEPLPIVAFDCDTGPSEIIQHDVTGFLVNKLDIDDVNLKKKTEYL